MKSTIKAIFRDLPPSLQRLGHATYAQVFLRLKSMSDAGLKKGLFGNKADCIPPLHFMEDGPQNYRDFFASGEEAFAVMTQECGLKPTDRVLDIGSGIGRKTWPLLGYLTGTYEGLDPIQ
jgi:hypothetical protein